jgi:hypothetical protein
MDFLSCGKAIAFDGLTDEIWNKNHREAAGKIF